MRRRERDLYCWIYGLADPRTNEIRYVGMTTNMMRRYRGHLANTNPKKYFPKKKCECPVESRNLPHSKMKRWIIYLRKHGHWPMIRFLISRRQIVARKFELLYIKKMSRIGHRLFNREA